MEREKGNWKCIYDPTRTGDYPGDFFGGYFRICDLLPRYQPFQHIGKIWPEGIIFKNIKTGQILTIRNGSVKKVDESSYMILKK
jgi:hypothetical protein